ncbi:MAG: DUF1275 domain-containing protein [Bdellovibrionales bacterium]|nr:DUF1275 domain-containing protein [Oligoflexia bacterium]
MYRLEREEFLKFPLVGLWALLGFQAGFVNAFGFLACSRYVSHVTGFGTQIGVAVAESQLWTAFELFGFPASFIAGAFLNGLLTSARTERGLRPHYEVVTLLLPLILALICLAGELGLIGAFSDTSNKIHDFILLYSLSFVCGLQNACFATFTKGQIRTTHLTGISTDFGTDLARIHFGSLPPEELKLARRANLSRVATFLFFSLGSVLSVILSESLGYSALMVPIISAAAVAVVVRAIKMQMDKIHQPQRLAGYKIQDVFSCNATSRDSSSGRPEGSSH